MYLIINFFKLIVKKPSSCEDLYYNFGVKNSAYQLVYPLNPDVAVKVYCRMFQFKDGTKLK